MSTNRHEGCKRQFIHLSRAWYGDVNLAKDEAIDQMSIGYYHPGGGTTGEFSIEWLQVGGEPTPRLQAFEDSWDALWGFKDFLKALKTLDGTNPTPEEIGKVLLACGIEDATPEDPPYKSEKKGNVCAHCGQEIKEKTK